MGWPENASQMGRVRTRPLGNRILVKYARKRESTRSQNSMDLKVEAFF
jgi:hypothetical protein